jgi:hypothetical protein
VGVIPRCSGVKRDNSQCERIVGETNSFCFAHDPSRKAERSANASKAGKSRQGQAVGDLHRIKETLLKLGDDLVAGKANRGNAAVAATCFGTAIKAIEAETRLRELIEARLVETQLRVQEQNELIGRLEELEERLSMEKSSVGTNGGGRWGA